MLQVSPPEYKPEPCLRMSATKNICLGKLEHYGIDSKILLWITNFLNNRVPSCVNSKVRLFADDCLLYREIKNNQDQIDMHSMGNIFYSA